MKKGVAVGLVSAYLIAMWAYGALLFAYDDPCNHPDHPAYAFSLELFYQGNVERYAVYCEEEFYDGLWTGIKYGPILAPILGVIFLPVFALPIGFVIGLSMVVRHVARNWLRPRSAP